MKSCGGAHDFYPCIIRAYCMLVRLGSTRPSFALSDSEERFRFALRALERRAGSCHVVSDGLVCRA
jgi:hypothetical protein